MDVDAIHRQLAPLVAQPHAEVAALLDGEPRARGRDWTEYTLYWTHACVSGLAKTRHVPSPRKLKLYDGDSGFEWNSWREWSATRAFADESFVFSVLQSISGVAPAWVSQQIAPVVA